jgi:hypothetical protein
MIQVELKNAQAIIHATRDAAPKKLYTTLRADLRKASNKIAGHMKTHVKESKPNHEGTSGRLLALGKASKSKKNPGPKLLVSEGVRDAIAQGISGGVSTKAKNKYGVMITASSEYLPRNKKAMMKAYNKSAWRHPVYGNKGKWVKQEGNPYFGSIAAQHVDELEADVVKAITKVLEEVAAMTDGNSVAFTQSLYRNGFK